MLDQSFTPKNLRKIYEKENRKGIHLEDLFPTTVREKSLILKKERAIKKRIRRRKEKLDLDTYTELKRRLREKIKYIKEDRDELIDSHLQTISDNISNKKFNLTIQKHDTPHHDKQTYKISNNQESFFAAKQLQENIKKTYNVKQADRNSITSQLLAILGDPFPKHIIRTDISSFYENIDRKVLQDKIDSRPELSLASRKMIKKVLKDYETLSDADKGIPRGVGISAYLSELYMKNADEKIQSLPNVIYYTRYVDDLIVIFSPSPDDSTPDHISDVEHIIEDAGLSLNPNKTSSIAFRNGNNFSFEYLGYKFSYGANLKVEISGNKIKRYKYRVNSSFTSYHNSHRGKHARRLLIDRIRLLTGNTKLTNNKGGAFVGIHNSNKWINDYSHLKGLDLFLAHKIRQIDCPNLRKRLEKLSFEEGFNKKTYRHYSAKQLGKLTKAWRH